LSCPPRYESADRRQWLDLTPHSHTFRHSAVCLLAKLAAKSGQMPPTLFLTGINIDDWRYPSFAGGFCDIFRGTYQGQTVAIKRPRVVDGVSNPSKVSTVPKDKLYLS
jgi:hypothetical protein